MINPVKAGKRYANLFGRSFKQGRQINRDEVPLVDAIDDLLDNAVDGGVADRISQLSGWMTGYRPMQMAGSLIGTGASLYAANHFLGNPVGNAITGGIDWATNGATNLRPDTDRLMIPLDENGRVRQSPYTNEYVQIPIGNGVVYNHRLPTA